MLLHWWREWLNDKDITLPTVGLKLNFDAVIAKAADSGWAKTKPEMLTDLRRQEGVGTATKDRNLTHRLSPCSRHPSDPDRDRPLVRPDDLDRDCLMSIGGDELPKTIEEILIILWTGASLWMILDREGWECGMVKSLTGAIIEMEHTHLPP